MLLICILPKFFKWIKIKDVKKLCQDIENDAIIKDQMAGLGCLFVCTFGNYLMPALIAAHTATNVAKQRGLWKLLKWTASLYVVTITTSSPSPGGPNKMIDLFKKMYFGVLSGRCATKKFCRAGAYFLFLTILKHRRRVMKQWHATQTCWGISLTALKHKKCVLRQSRKIHCSCSMCLISIRYRKCVLRQSRKAYAL